MKKAFGKIILSAIISAVLGCVFSFGAGAVTGVEDGVISFAAYEAGDVNGDKAVDIKDLVCMKKYIAGVGNVVNIPAADINEDSQINSDDLILLRQILFDA